MEPVVQKILANTLLNYQRVHIQEGRTSLMFVCQFYSKIIRKMEDTQHNIHARKFMIPIVKGLLDELKVLERRMVKLLHSLNTPSE